MVAKDVYGALGSAMAAGAVRTSRAEAVEA
jgi:hypothetical protein